MSYSYSNSYKENSKCSSPDFNEREHVLFVIDSTPTLGVQWNEQNQNYTVPIILDDESIEKISKLMKGGTLFKTPLSSPPHSAVKNILHLDVPGLTQRQERELLNKGRLNIVILFEYVGIGREGFGYSPPHPMEFEILGMGKTDTLPPNIYHAVDL